MSMPAERRRVLGEYWTRMGLTEHASVAAFSRFVTELLALGAPQDLVHEAQVAMADEIAHAGICFGLASAHAETPPRPARLPMKHLLDEVETDAVALDIFVEGCVAETIAALEAREVSRRAADPVVRSMLERVAGDERRHAELAWCFLQWILKQHPDLGEMIEGALAVLLDDAEEHPTRVDHEWLWEHGAMPEQARAALRTAVLRDVVKPCVDRLVRFELELRTHACSESA